jgi:hypothetical protein
MNNRKYLDITRNIILSIIDKNNIAVFLFGSRTNEFSGYNSDIDVGFMSERPIEDKLFSRIREELEDSIVPFHIDLVDFNKSDKKFREIALEKIEIWNNSKNLIIS